MLKAKVRKHPEVWLAKFKKEYAALTTQKDDNIKKCKTFLLIQQLLSMLI